MLFPKRIQEATRSKPRGSAAGWRIPTGRPFAIAGRRRRAEYPVPQAKNHGKYLARDARVVGHHDAKRAFLKNSARSAKAPNLSAR